MKRLITLCLSACFVFGSFDQARALEIQTHGQMDFVFGVTDNNSMIKDEDERDHFFARQRARIAVDFIANENLKGVLQVQFGTMDWGREGAQLDTNRESGTTRRAYLDWSIPDTGLDFKIGLQEIALPSFTFGNPFLHAQVAGIAASARINENIDLVGLWARPFDSGRQNSHGDEMDLFGLVGMLDYDSLRLAPWFVYGSVGASSNFWEYRYENGQIGMRLNPLLENKTGRLYVGGLAFEISPTDSLGIHLDAMYGYMDTRSPSLLNLDNDLKARGWMASFLLDYELKYGTPGLLAWYSSGDDADDVRDGKLGRLPVAQGISDGFTPARLAFPGAISCGDDTKISYTGVGTWGLGLQFADLSFTEKLSHTARIVYIQGTNDKKLRGMSPLTYLWGDVLGAFGEQLYLTAKDSLVEFGIDSQYRIYDNLAAHLEIGYLMTDFSRKTLGGKKDADLFNAQLTLRYEF